MAKETTTLYIDDSAIWVLVSRGREARKWSSMPLKPGLVKNGVILNQDAVAAQVKELWQTQEIGGKRVISSTSGINCFYRLISLPELPKNILPEAVKREAANILAAPLEQLYLSWQTLPASKGETLIYLAASPRNSVDALISTLRQAELDPYLMDLRPLALARTTTEPKAIIIDAQPYNFDIVVLIEGIPQVVRSLPLAPEALLEEKMPLMRRELERAVTFYNSSHMENPIEPSIPVLVSGELAQQQDAWKLLLGKQKYPVQVLPSPLEAPEGFPASQYATNIGLALKEAGLEATGYSLVNLNVLPETYLPKPRPISQVLLVPVIIAGIALVALLGFFNITTSTHIADLRADLAAVNQMAISQHAQPQVINALNQEVSSLEATAAAFATTLDNFSAGRNEINADLAQINSCLPGAVPSVTVSDDTKTLTVQGLANNKKAVFDYAKELRASGRFALVVITNMRRQEQQISFSLTLSK